MGAASFAACGCDGPAAGVLGAGAAAFGVAGGAGCVAVGVDGAIGFWALLADARIAAAMASVEINARVEIDLDARRTLPRQDKTGR